MRNQNLGIWTPHEAEAWDLVVPRSQTIREVSFLTWAFGRFADRKVNEVLDLGCGTGRLAIELASRGYTLTGIDKFGTMLKRARQNASKNRVSLRLVRTPLEELAVSGKFDAAYSVFSVFNYVLDEDALTKTLSKLKTLLRPGGLLLVDMMNFASLFESYKRTITQSRRGQRWSIQRQVTHRVDAVNMLWYHREATRMKLDDQAREWKETHTLRMWMFPEFRKQLLNSGFSRVHLFGQMRAGTKEATTQARRLVIISTRA